MSDKAIISWSSGKDSAYALWVAQQSRSWDIVGALTTVTGTYDRVAMHGVRRTLLRAQAQALGLPLTEVEIPSACTNEIYEERFGAALLAVRERGIRTVIFGDLFLEDIRAYRVRQLTQLGMEGVFPLWQRDTRALAAEMIASGLRATLVCLDPRVLDRRFAGRTFDQRLLDELPAGVDPCGENGEFHTFVWAGPMFQAPISVVTGEVVERGGFVFADVLPADS